MDGGALYSIGDLARRTGLTVKAIRFYSDSGLVPPTGRTPAGYRRYGVDAVARLDLVRTLRDLGIDLPTIRKVVDRETTLSEVAAAHADALAVQIRTLRLRRAVLTAVAKRGPTPEEMDLMHKLARLSEEERHRLIEDFLDAAFGDGAGFAGIRRTLTPELPDNPEPDQVEAWIELAELSQDPDFRDSMRRTAEQYTAQGYLGSLRRDPVALVRDLVAPAVAAGIDPASSQADPFVAAVLTEYDGEPGDLGLITQLETASDPRRDRYLHLLAVINAWPRPESPAPMVDWFIQALRPRIREESGR
jgi:DNA-binding transcriptional MerR regulator